MATPVQMPNVGISVESCILTKWHKKKGDQVKAGDVLFTYETDKTTTDEVAEVDGTLIDVFFDEDSDIPVMTNIAVIGTPGESTAEFAPTSAKTDTVVPAPVEKEKPQSQEAAQTTAPVVSHPQEGFIRISPRARALAKKLGADYRFAVPTGAEGRICEEDIRTLVKNGPMSTKAAAGEFDGRPGTGIGGKFSVSDIGSVPSETANISAVAYVDEKLSGVRKAIAKSMSTSLFTIPQLTHNISFDATEILSFRTNLKKNAETLGLANITLNDIIVYAVSRILAKEEHKALNANLIDSETIRYFNGVHLGVAMDTPRGLLVPTLFNADKKSLNQISVELKALAVEAKDGSIAPDKLKGASFTISNLGSFGIESFTPVINPPQTGILGVDTVMTRVKDVDGVAVPYSAMGLSLTYDHRAVDGTPASKFLVDLKTALENFSLLLCK